MKRFIVLISALFCLSFAQDIAGSWTLTGVDVNYYNFARPNAATAGQAYADMGYQFYTPLTVSDTYGLNATLPLAWLPPGYMFLSVRNGPFGEGGLAANGVNLNVTLYSDGTGIIPEGSTYPDISLNPDLCITTGGVLPVTDDVVYSSNKDSGATLPLTDITGTPSTNPYAGTTMGSMSLSQSVVFSFFPIDAVPDVSPWLLFFDAETPAVYPVADENGLYPTLGVTGGFIKTEGFDGSIGDADALTTDQPEPDLALYWHTMDGYSSDTGFGDEGLAGGDEDGDGAIFGEYAGEFDRIFGLPAISATYVDPGLAASFGFGTDFNRLIAGDITAELTGLVYDGCLGSVAAGAYDGCIASVTDEVNGQCEAVFAGGVQLCCVEATGSPDCLGSPEATAGCEAYVNSLPGGAAGSTVTYLASTIIATLDPPLLDQCDDLTGYFETLGMPTEQAELYAVSALVENLCLGAGFDSDACSGEEGSGGLVGLVTVDYGVTTCAALDANSGTLAAAAGGLVESTDDNASGLNCDEWAFSVADGFAAQSAETGYQTCTDLSAFLNAGLAGLLDDVSNATAIATLDAMAAGSPLTSYMTCTDAAAYTVAGGTSVTTTDDYDDATIANEVYVMNPDPNFALWNQFVTFNGYMYGESGNAAFLVADYDHNLDWSTVFFISAATGAPCDPMSGDPYCAIPVAPGSDGQIGTADDGGRLIFKYNPTCVPVLEAMEVQTEFVGFAEGECTHDGDVTGNSSVDVLDVVALVQYVIGNADLTDEEQCRADINSDSAVNVLDVVAIVQSIVNPRGEAATSAEFSRTSEALEMNANGVVDAVQMTLSHGNDFSIELTDNALVAEYNTVDNQTTLMVVLPEEGKLFSSTGEYTIDEVIAANASGYIETSMPVSFNLSDAYPNPFNPSTSLDIELSYESNVSVMAYNVMGQMVSVLHDGNMAAGMHSITWDASNLASGMYIIKAEVADEVLSQKVMLLK